MKRVLILVLLLLLCAPTDVYKRQISRLGRAMLSRMDSLVHSPSRLRSSGTSTIPERMASMGLLMEMGLPSSMISPESLLSLIHICNDALLNQGDQVAAEPVFDNVRTHGQDDRASVAPRRHHALDQFVKIRVFPRRNRVYPRGFQILNFYQVDACLLYTSASIARRCSSVNCIFPPRFSARACSRFALLRRWPQV